MNNFFDEIIFDKKYFEQKFLSFNVFDKNDKNV